MNDGLRPFRPAPGLGSAFVQSVLASKRPAPRLWRRAGIDLDRDAVTEVLDCRDEAGQPVRLQGYRSDHDGARVQVVLLHGWEGSHQSNYLYGVGCALYADGHHVYRLNLRDHGGTHHLNRDMFHSARLREVVDALSQVAARHPTLPLVVLGFSQGGNFALRIGLQGPGMGLQPRLCAAISPVMRPAATLAAIDGGPRLIHRYFIDKWHQTLRRKADAWPGQFDFSGLYAQHRFLAITEAFVDAHTDYPSMGAYLDAYTLQPEQLIESPTPLAILTAEDDSVIPIDDFAGLRQHGSVIRYDRTSKGGHCGFVDRYSLHSWAEDWARAQVIAALD
jgi:uncharacterized protein